MSLRSNTKDALKSALEYLGWTRSKRGRGNTITGPEDVREYFEGLTYSDYRLLCLCMRVMMYRMDSYDDVREVLGVESIRVPKSTDATDEVTVARVFPR